MENSELLTNYGFYKSQSNVTPLIEFNPHKGVLYLTGRSCPENPR